MKLKSYVILKRCKKTNKIHGLINLYGHPQWSENRVQVFKKPKDRYKKTPSYGEFIIQLFNKYVKKRDKNYYYFIARVGSKNCPIKIDWRKIFNRDPTKNYNNKYSFKEN